MSDAKNRVSLTETAIRAKVRAAAELGTRLELVDVGGGRVEGLRLRVGPSGSASWILGCRDRSGAARRFPLGSWPAVGLSGARDAARALREKVKGDGADPIAERRRDRAIGADAKAGVGTLAALLDVYEAQECGGLKSWPESRKRIAVVFKPLMARPVAMMTLGDLQLAADSYRSARSGEASPKSAAFAVRTLRPALKWASAPGRAYISPELAGLSAPGKVKARDRTLTRDELAALLPALRASCRPYGAALHLMLLTLARREEVATARWRDIDMKGGTWTIPASAAKNGQAHIIPLSSRAAELLRSRLPADGDPSAFIFSTSTGARLLNWDRETKAIHAASGTAGWTRHDLRRTGATLLGEMGVDPHIIEAALNHVSIHSQLAATYNRSRYRPQVAAALQRLADALDGIESGAGEIVPLRAGAQ